MQLIRNILLFCLWITISGTAFGQEAIKRTREYYKDHTGGNCLALFADTSAPIRQIVLIRHAEPDLDKKGCRNRDEAIRFFSAYDSAGIVPFDKRPLCLESIGTSTVLHSSLPRARQSAKLAFGQGFEYQENDRYREFERKTMKFCNIRLPLKCWTTSSRLLWLMGLNDKGIESFREARSRARENANVLADKTTGEEQVILLAHGLHNRYVKKYLKKLGWKEVYDSGNAYLSVKIMAREVGNE